MHQHQKEMTAEASIVFVLKKLKTCQTDEACLSALSNLPESQRCTLTEAMGNVQKYLGIARGSVEAAGREIDKDWVAMARRVALLVDEVLDKYLYHARQQEEAAGQTDHQEGLDKVVDWAETIQKHVKKLAQLGELSVPASNLAVAEPSQSFVDRVWHTGRNMVLMPQKDDDHHKYVDLQNFLTNEYLTDFFSLERSRKVLCIVESAMSTTGQANAIASHLYNDAKSHFKCSFSVTLHKGDPAETKKVLPDKLAGQDISICGDSSEPDHIGQISKALNKKSYIALVNDDLGEARTWDNIKDAFPHGSMCSRVIVTTRRLDVAEKCFWGESDLIYELRSPPPCTDSQRQASDDDVLKGVPKELRDYCLYLSTVPNDQEFDMCSMVKKWVAEGLIFADEDGYKHFGELLRLNFIEVYRQYGRFGEGATYKIKTSQKKNFATRVGSAEGHNKVSRFFLHVEGSMPAAPPSGTKPRWRHARSMTVRGHAMGVVKVLEGLHLHVLDLYGCTDLNDHLVAHICRKLVLLRYLSIRNTPVAVLSEEVGNLKNLETLDVRQTHITELPKEIHSLARLALLLDNQGEEMIKAPEDNPKTRIPSSLKDNEGHRRTLAVLDITVWQLDKGDLKTLGKMRALRKLALALAGVQSQEIVITDGLFAKLEVFELDCRAPRLIFQEEAMPELRRLYLRIYAGPKRDTPSGTNHLKKLHQVTLHYSPDYADSASLKETTRVMVEEAHMRANPMTIVIGGQVTLVPKVHVPDKSQNILVWVARKFMRFFFDWIFILVPFASRFRPHMARMPKRLLAVVFLLLLLLCYFNITLLLRMKPLLLSVSSWLANTVVPLLLLCFLSYMAWGSKWAFIIVPILTYRVFFLAWAVFQTAILPLCWLVIRLPRLLLVHILRPAPHLLLTFSPLLAPIVCTLILCNKVPGLSQGYFLILLPVITLLFYFLPSLFHSAIFRMPLLVVNILKWLLWGA